MTSAARDLAATTPRRPVRVMWQSPTPNANGRYWRILTNGRVERMPRGWKPEGGRRERP